MKRFCILVVCLISGCANFVNPPPLYPPGTPLDIPPPPKRNGTIYQRGHDIRLYEDKIARRIGDILTVRLEESTKGEYKGKTKTDKKAQLNYPVPTLFGQAVPGLEVQTNTQQTFDATGNSDESDKLIGTISVTVTGIMANGNLRVQGESWVAINQGQKYLQLCGIVRQIDIEPDNVISSQRIAAARINYGAQGQAGYATSGGLFTRLFNRFAPY